MKEGGLIAKLIASKKSPEECLSELYVRCFSRKPETEELAKLAPLIKGAKDKNQALDDIFWALLNSREFLFNH